MKDPKDWGDASPEEWARWVENRRQFVIETATAPPTEPMPLLLAVQEVWKWLFAIKELKARVAESDFQFLNRIVNDLRELPLSTERQYWAPASLREKDLKALSIEKRVREDILIVFARIADNLKQIPQSR